MLLAWTGVLMTAAGALAFYLATPHQQITAEPRAPQVWGWAGAGGLVIGLVLLLNWAGPATAVFIVLTVAILVWSTVPLVAAWIRYRGEKG